MKNEDIIKLNRDRLDLHLKKLKDLSYDGQKGLLTTSVITKDDKVVKLNDIDFKDDCVFISNSDILSVLSYVGIILLNNIDLKDTTLTGTKSRITSTYMVVTANDAKLAYVSSGLTEFDPDGWRLENYVLHDLVIWNLPKILGVGTEKDTNTIINSINSLYEMRKFNNKINWMFFVGSEKEFNDIYGSVGLFNKYVIKTKEVGSKKRRIL